MPISIKEIDENPLIFNLFSRHFISSIGMKKLFDQHTKTYTHGKVVIKRPLVSYIKENQYDISLVLTALKHMLVFHYDFRSEM